MKILNVFLALLFLVPFVSADVTVTGLELDLDYANINDDELEVSKQFTIKNNGAEETFKLEVINQKSGVKLDVSPKDFTLAAGAEKKITLSGDMEPQDKGTIASLKVGNQVEPINIKIQEMLELKKIEVELDGDEQGSIDSNGEKIRDISPGKEVKLSFSLDNRYDEDFDDGDISGTITVKLDDNDFGDEIDEEISFDLNPDERNSFDVTFKVPSDADAQDYDLEIEIEAEDEYDIEYDIKWEVELQVERQRNDLRLEDFTVDPKSYSCAKVGKVSLKLTNYGAEEEKLAKVVIESETLNINQEYDTPLDRGRNSDNSKTIEHSFDVTGATAGTHTISATAYHDRTKAVDRELREITVSACEKETPKETVKEETAPVVVTTTSENNEQPKEPVKVVNNNAPKETTEVLFEDTKLFLAMMIGALVLAALIVIGLLFVI